MAKLKCWKKTRDDKYAKVYFRKDNKIAISIESPLKALKVEDGWSVYYGNPNNASSKGFKTRSQSFKFANKYMRKNDKC